MVVKRQIMVFRRPRQFNTQSETKIIASRLKQSCYKQYALILSWISKLKNQQFGIEYPATDEGSTS